mmetsp:Transcript_44769/g.37673  ORF Transcript_44769/g.37673 Transcript_44769/m.37673 type:complete len:253 (+) Transcript_44769:1192-1950(+)
MKIEVSKMKDNLAETSSLLTIENNRALLLSTQSSIQNAGDFINYNANTNNTNNTKSTKIDSNLRVYKSLANDELLSLREEVSRLKHQVHKISFHGNSDDTETIKLDLSIVRENKSKLISEKQKVMEVYKTLLEDKQQFKTDLEEFKLIDKDDSEYISKKEVMKKIKQLLDTKITNVNSCINSLSKVEIELNEMERALEKKLRDDENDDTRSEFSMMNDRADVLSNDTGDIWNLNTADGKLSKLYRHISEIQT